ncbi:putative laccase-9 [Vitis vinifera]|uniref:laccase n=1 Tax=Vitis vinifera TaxID=29760 RepID=A0A438IDS2_VITVI|nr:putative laccase-9 [Vitis vinifera]
MPSVKSLASAPLDCGASTGDCRSGMSAYMITGGKSLQKFHNTVCPDCKPIRTVDDNSGAEVRRLCSSCRSVPSPAGTWAIRTSRRASSTSPATPRCRVLTLYFSFSWVLILSSDDSDLLHNFYSNSGDLVYVNVHNQDDFGVTIHWHGVKQTRNPWSDGPDHITQCRIQPGTNFTYKVIFGEDQEGTLWWHAHSDWTRATVHGAIVILPTQGTTYPFPKPDGEHLLEFLSNQTVTTLDDIAFTINGEPGDLVACGGETTHRWLVDYGKTYLLRIVNAVVNSELFFAISEHNLTIVGTDGTYTKPRVTSYIMIAPGQTMDVLITTNQSLSHYYMAARQFVTLESSIAEFNNMTATAILQYRGNYPPPDVPSFPANLPLFHDLDSGLGFLPLLRSLATPEHPVSVPLKITTRMLVTASINKVNYTFEGTEVSHLAASLNNITFMDPTSSILLAYYRVE